MDIKAKIVVPDGTQENKLSGKIDLSQAEFIKESEMDEYTKWFNDRFPGEPVVVSSDRVDAYRYISRISSYPKQCPVTGLPFFMEIEQDGELVPTYGGPYDSYTIPIKDDEIQEGEEELGYTTTRYCHDTGGWIGDIWFTIEKK